MVLGLSYVETDARLLLRKRQEKNIKIYAYICQRQLRERERLGHRTRRGTKIAFCARTAVPYMDRAVQSTRHTDILADYHRPSSEALRRAAPRKDVECDSPVISKASQYTWLG